MKVTIGDNWRLVRKPASIRIVNDGLRKSIDWVEASTDDSESGPMPDSVYSRYVININEPLTSPYVNIWIRASDPFKNVEVDIIHPITG